MSNDFLLGVGFAVLVFVLCKAGRFVWNVLLGLVAMVKYGKGVIPPGN